MHAVYTDLNHHSSVSTCVVPSDPNHHLLSSRPTCTQFTLTHTTIICQVPVYSYHGPKPSFFCRVPVYSYHWPKTSLFCQVTVYTSYWPTLSFFCQTGPPVHSSHWPRPSFVKYLFTVPTDPNHHLVLSTCLHLPLTKPSFFCQTPVLFHWPKPYFGFVQKKTI